MAKSHVFILFAWIAIMAAGSCNTNQPLNREAVNQEIQDRKIKRITPAQMTEQAMKIGNEIADLAQAQLIRALTNAISTGGVEYAVEFCQLNALGILDSLNDQSSVYVSRVSDRYRNSRNEPDSLESILLEAYAYAVEEGLPLAPNVIEEAPQVLLYTRPIILPGGLCLQCHGVPGKDIQSTTLAKIDSLYPTDKARGYQAGELRGMWAIRIPKKVVAQKI